MKLTREQRSALFAGDPPRITFPGDAPCPIKPGHVEVLSAHVKFEVTGARRNKKGEWVLVYTLYNNRLGQRFLAVQDGQKHPEQYAHSGGSAVDEEAGEAVDDFTQRRITKESRENQRKAIEELFIVLEDLRGAVNERLAGNPEARKLMGRDAWALKSKIDAVERRLRRRHAA